MFTALGQPFAVRAVDDGRLITLAELSMMFDGATLCPAAVGALEPRVPWMREFLIMRRDCYRQHSDPRLTLAEDDLIAFASREAQPIATFVSARPH